MAPGQVVMTITIPRRAKLRIWLAAQLIKLAGWLLYADVEVVEAKTNGSA